MAAMKASYENSVLSLWYEALKLLVVTDGEKGCRYFTKAFKGNVKGYSVKTVHTTGAGDAFVGAILYIIAKDTSVFGDEEKLREAIEFAYGAACVLKSPKSSPPLPTTINYIFKF